MKNRLMPVVMSVFMAVLLAAPLAKSDTQATENPLPLSVEETHEKYIRAVQDSDLEALFETVTSKEPFTFLTTTGELIDTRAGYYKFHQEWFKEKDWEISFDLREAHEGKDYGYTIARFYYQSRTPEGGTYFLDSYFTLIFHKENGLWKVIGDVCTPISRKYSEANRELQYDAEQNYLFHIIRHRRTVRKFQSTPVPEEHIMKILAAARFAPTAGNQQPWKFLVIRNREKLEQLKQEALLWYLEAYKSRKSPDEKELAETQEAVRKALANALSAPVYVAVLVDTTAQYPDYVLYDGTLAAGYLMIAARALGYGTGFFTTFFPDAKMKEFFRIPAQYKLICFTPIGVPEKWPETPPKKNLEDLVVFESF